MGEKRNPNTEQTWSIGAPHDRPFLLISEENTNQRQRDPNLKKYEKQCYLHGQYKKRMH